MGTRMIIRLGALAVLVFTGMLAEHADARTYTVGDSSGWRIPPGGASDYTNWASRQTFAVGDVLVFNYPTGLHDVARVTKAAFDACNSSSPISLDTVGPTNITLNSTGEKFFFCTFGQHCLAGQKLAINVTAATSPSPSPAPSPEKPPSPSPSPSPSPTPTPTPTPSPTPTPTPSPSPTPTPSPSPTPTTTPSPSISPTSPAPGGGGAGAPSAPTPPGTPSPSPPEGILPPPGGASPPPAPGSAARATSVASFFAILISATIWIVC